MSENQIRFLLFDLDETLYDAHDGMFREVGSRIHRFLQQHLGLTPEESESLRRRYYQRYGTTLRGLQLHHQIDTDAYLHFVHDFEVTDYIQPHPALDAALEALPGRKVIFTNATTEYGRRVLRALGIEHHFERIFDVRSMQFYSKPDRRGFELVLQALPAQGSQCLLIDDNRRNVEMAEQLGMRTILVDPRAEEGSILHTEAAAERSAEHVVDDILAAIEIAQQIVQGKR